MRDRDNEELATLYVSWTDEQLTTAATVERSQYRGDALALILQELSRRCLAVPSMPPELPEDVASAPMVSGRAFAFTLRFGAVLIAAVFAVLSVVARLLNFGWVWIVLPVIPALIMAPFEHVFGWELNAGNSGVYVVSLFVIVTIPTGLMAIAGLTIAVLVRRRRERRRL